MGKKTPYRTTTRRHLPTHSLGRTNEINDQYDTDDPFYPTSPEDDDSSDDEESLHPTNHQEESSHGSNDPTDNDDDEDEELDVQPPKAPTKPTTSRSRGRSNQTITTASKSSKSTSKSRHTASKSATATPKSSVPLREITPAQQDETSPISEEFHSSRQQRRAESVTNMGGKSDRKKVKDLEDKNKEKDAALQKLLDESNELKRKLANAEKDHHDDEFQVPLPARGGKKQRTAKHKMKSKRGLTTDDFVKKTAKTIFRYCKFVADDAQFRKKVGDLVMDRIEIVNLLHEDGETAEESRKVESYRDKFYQEWQNVMASGWNEERNYRQGRVKEACILKWMKPKNTPKLFSVEDLEIVMKRDFSEWEPKTDEDGNETTNGDPDKLAYYRELFDFYIEEMVPAAAGCRPFSPAVRHFVNLSEARFPDSVEYVGGELIVPPSTEAAILLFFKNARRKWEMMYDWEYVKGHTNKKTHPFPKWSPTEPEKNLEWKTLYSDSSSGQNPYMGWKKAGMREFVRLTRMMIDIRKDKDLCEYEETKAVQRLHAAAKYKDKAEQGGSDVDEDDDGEALDLDFDENLK